MRSQHCHLKTECFGGWMAPCCATKRITFEPRYDIHVFLLSSLVVTPLQQRSSQRQLGRCDGFFFFPAYICFNLWLHEILGISSYNLLHSFINLSHFIWLDPASPSLACLLLLLNKSSWDMSRLEEDFQRKVPSALCPSFKQAESSGPKGERIEKMKKCLQCQVC